MKRRTLEAPRAVPEQGLTREAFQALEELCRSFKQGVQGEER